MLPYEEGRAPSWLQGKRLVWRVLYRVKMLYHVKMLYRVNMLYCVKMLYRVKMLYCVKMLYHVKMHGGVTTLMD